MILKTLLNLAYCRISVFFGSFCLLWSLQISSLQAAVIGLSLVNSQTEEVLLEISDGTVINLDELNLDEFGIKLSIYPQSTQSVSFSLNGPQKRNQIENIRPYSLFGDGGASDILGVTTLPGNYTLSVQLFTEPNLAGEVLGDITVSFSMIRNQGFKLNLVNADSGATLFELSDSLKFNPWASNPFAFFFTIVADNIPTGTESIEFVLDGPLQQTLIENMAPYSLYGDEFDGTQFNGAIALAGTYTIRARAFDADSAVGNLLDEIYISFSFARDIRLEFFDADTDQVLFDFTGQDVSLDSFPDLNAFSLKLAEYPIGTRSARFSFNGPISTLQLENTLPYTAFGDKNGGLDLVGQPTIIGTYLVVVSTFDQVNAKGNRLSDDTFIFSFETETNPASVVNPLSGTGGEVLVMLPRLNQAKDFKYSIQFENQIKRGQIRIPATTRQIVIPMHELTIPPGSIYYLNYEFNHRRESIRLVK